MRVMLRAYKDTAATNEGIKGGALPEATKKLMASVKPEAAPVMNAEDLAKGPAAMKTSG